MASIGGKDTDTIARMLLDADPYKAELRNVAKEINKLKAGQRAAKLVQKEYDKVVQQTETHIKKLTRAIKTSAKANLTAKNAANVAGKAMMGITAAAAGLTAGLSAALTKGKEMNDLWAANTLGIDQARTAAKGYISDQSLLVAANRATQFELGFSEEQFAKLTKGAVVASKAIGGNVPKAMEDLMTGLARGSNKILDNLGILVSVEKANKAWAKSLGITVEQLTEADKKQAFINASLKDLDRLAGNAELKISDLGTAYSALKTSADNATGAASRFIASLATGTPTLAGWITGLNEASEAMNKMSDPRRRRMQEISAELTGMTGKIVELKKQVDFTRREFKPGAEPFFQPDLQLSKALSFYNKYNALQREFTRNRTAIEKEAADKEYNTWQKGQQRIAKAQVEAFEAQQAMLAKQKGGTGKGKTPWSPTISAIAVELETLGLLADIYGEKILKTVRFWEGTKGAVEKTKVFVDDMTAAVTAYNTAIATTKSTMESFSSFDFLGKILEDDQYDAVIQQMNGLDATWQGVVGNMMDGAHGVIKAVNSAVWEAIKGQKSLGAALQSALSSFLSTFGEKMSLLALEQAAAAIVSLATGDYAGAGMHAAAAAAYGVAAMAAGAATAMMTPATTSSASSTASDRGLGGSLTTAPRSQQQATQTFYINSIGGPTDELATLVVDSMARAGNMGLVEFQAA
jgi:hypothetical protein